MEAQQQAPLIVNGREYPLWSQFVNGKAKWIGGTIEDFGDNMDRALGVRASRSKITDITLAPNGDESAFFMVHGEKHGCGFDVRHGGITGGEPGWLTFSGYGGHQWRIKAKDAT